MKYAKRLLILGIIFLAIFVVVSIARQPKSQNSSGNANTKLENRENDAEETQSLEPADKRFRATEREMVTDPLFKNHERIDSSLRTELANHFSPPTSKVVSTDLKDIVREVKSEVWLDPEDKAIRRRIRIVDADFKYTKLRLEETVTWNPNKKSCESVLSKASVADHVMVKIKPGVDLEVLGGSLDSLGYQVRAVLSQASVADHVMAQIKPRVDLDVLGGSLDSLGLQVQDKQADGLILVEIPDSDDAAAHLDAVEQLNKLESFIDYSEPDYLLFTCATPNDPLYASGEQRSLHNTLNSKESRADADIDAPEGWSVRNTASNITVAVLDTGVRYTHEDLANRMWDDGLGNPGWDAYDGDNDPMDTDGHGTHCAGIIGAQGNNGVGITGVAWDVDIMAVRFIGEFGGTTSDAIRAINFARENGADVISASWGGSGFSRGLQSAIVACYSADIPFVTAAGNERWNVDNKPQYPACYVTPCIVSVAATTPTDELTTFSNYGYTYIDIAAPGQNILSCGIASDTDYRYLSGTSAAAPHVAGALALAKAQHGAEPVDRLITRLLRSVDRIESLVGKVGYEGRLNLHQLLLSSTTGYDHDFFNTPLVFKYCSGYWCRRNADLTREPDEDTYSPDTGDRSAWFQWTAIGSGLLQFEAVGYQLGDISLVAFEGNVRNNLKRLKDNFAYRPTAAGEYSSVFIYVEKDKTYTFSVDSRTATNQVIAAKYHFTPANDMLSQATVIPTSTSFEAEGNNCSATVEPFEYQLQGHPFLPGHSVWWKWTPSVTGNYVVSTYGSDFDTVLGVYEANSSMTSMGTNDSRSLIDDTSRLELNLIGGQEYYILVASYGRDTVGNISLAAFPKEDIRFLQQPESQLVRLGDDFELSVIADTSSEATYEWFGPQGPLAGVGYTSRIRIPAAGTNDMGGYYVIVRDGESSGTSTTATITELALPPRFLFSPQDISVLDGTPIQMFAKADGLEPVTLKWFKQGVEIQTGHLYTIADSSPSDSGIYYVEASNAIGTTRSHPFQILVSTNTFGPLIYRSPGIPSAEKIKFVNGLHMGFGNDGRLIISTNGINWENPPIPQTMDIHDIAYDATLARYVIVGENRGGSTLAASAVSLDGRNWTKNPAPLPDWTSLEKVVAGNGIFVGYSTWLANKVYTTTNGVDWTPRDYTSAGSETWKQLQNIVFYNGEFIGGGRDTIFRSSDGINWTTNVTPNSGRILIWDGKLATFTGSPVGFSTSSDGINWTTPVQCVSIPSDLTRITSNGTRFYHAVGSTVASSPDGINWQQIQYDIKPTNPYASSANFAAVSGPEGNLVALGLAGIVQGPNYTQLVSPNPVDSFSLPPNTKIFGNTIYQLEDKGYTFKYSNDLRTWHSHTLDIEFEGDSLTKAAGKYWALRMNITGNESTLLSGLTPALINIHYAGTHNTGIYQIRSWNNELYGISGDQVFKLDVNSNWQLVYTMPKVINALEKIRGLKTIGRGMMIWSDYGAVYTSLNGTTWVRAQSSEPAFIVADSQHPTTKPRNAGPSFCEFNGKAYIYTAATNKMYVASNGFNFSTQLNLNPFAHFTAVPEGLLGIEGTTGWYSPDGTTWQQFPIHYLTYYFHHYNGTLLAYSQDGLYQAGTPASLAPTNSTPNLLDYQSGVSGSLFDLEYSVLDPENRFDRVEFYMNGVLAGQSTSASGINTLNLTGGGKRVIEMRSFDQDGQVTSNFWNLSVLSSPPDMVLYAPSTAPSAACSVWNNRLQVGVGNDLFSKIDDEWIGRTMPFTPSSSKFIFDPDAVFACGPNVGSNQHVFKSEDGIQWNSLNYYVESMKYQDGRYLAKQIQHRNVGQLSTLGVSNDGITWQKSSNGTLGSAAGNGIVVSVSGIGSGLSTIKSSNDGGATWTTRASLQIYSLQFDSGHFHGIGKTTYYRTTDGNTWTDLTPPLVAGEEIKFLDIAGGWYYLMTGGFNVSYMWISKDKGVTWTKLTDSPFPFSRVYYASGVWFAKRSNGIYASKDGLNWFLSITFGGTQQADIPYATSGLILEFFGHEDGATLATTNGLWTTRNGLNWKKENVPQATATPVMLSEPMTINASTRAINLQAKAFISADGTNWFQSPFVPASGHSIRHVHMFNNKLLIYSGANNQAHQLWESSDGINFSQVALSGNYFFGSIKKNSSRMFAKGNIVGGAFDQFFTSSDGANWTQLTTPAHYTSTIELENNTLTILDSFNQKIHHSADGVTWQTTNLKVENLVYGNGVFLASMNSTMYRGATITGLATVTSNATPYQAKLAFAGGKFYLKTTSGIWSSTDGQTWQQLYAALSGNLDVLNDTIYLNETTSLRPLIAADIQVSAVTGTPGNLAVGANINAIVSLKNIGDIAIPAGTGIQVRGALSRDGLFGNDDDVLAGTYDTVLDTELAVGGSTNIPVSFRVPGLRAGGGFKLVLIVDPDVPELTRTNNTCMTKATLVTVDEFVLNITRNGNGNVNQDFTARRYANGTLVTLSANAGKGSGFGGWTGGSVSPLSNITLMMNQNKNLTANFVENVTLNLAIKGNGSVDGWEAPGRYLSGGTVSLTAQPGTGWEFVGWTGSSSSTNPALSLTLNQNANLTAVFRQTMSGWKGQKFSAAELADPSISGDLVDADQDGIPNWHEYLHGSNPKDSRSKGMERAEIGGGFLRMIYTRNQGAEASYSLKCEASRDLSGWNATGFEERVLFVTNGIETIEARIPAGASNTKGFMRIKYENP